MKNSFAAFGLPFLIFALLVTIPSFAIGQVTWDGGGDGVNWTDPLNWDTDALPGSGDVINIGAGATVDYTGNLPGGPVTLNIDGTLNVPSGAIRLNGATLNVSSTGSLSSGFWDTNNGTINFQDGATASLPNWELKGDNVYSFELGATGFSTLMTGGSIREGAPAAITTTWIADLANYTGGTGIIDLVDFNSDIIGYTDADFIYSVVNAGPYTANLQYDEAGDIVQLNITEAAVPEPGSLALLGLAALGLGVRRRRN